MRFSRLRRAGAVVITVSMLAVGLMSAGFIATSPAGAQATSTYRLTFTNTSTGQPMTPPVAAIHDPGAIQLYTVGSAASAEVQAIAEGGNNGPLVALASAAPANVVSTSGVIAPNPAGPVMPGVSVTTDLMTTNTAHALSLVAMIVCTNDGFVGARSLSLPAAGQSTTVQLASYDAGTETNVLDPNYWVPPCGGQGNMHTDENGVVTAHPGQAGTGATDFAAGTSLATLTIENITPPPAPTWDYSVTFTNISTGQPMTPPVVAIHDASAVRLFQVGQAASTQVQAIAENGDNGPLVALATAAAPNVVSAAGVAAPSPAGPLMPGTSSTISLSTTSTTHALSFVSMVVCTNDGFTGLDSVALPTTNVPVFYDVMAYDAGTETNVLDPNYWVPPCGGQGNMHTDEGGVIAAHPGQAGTGATDFAAGTALMRVSITKTNGAAPAAAAQAPAQAAPAVPVPAVSTGPSCPAGQTCGFGFDGAVQSGPAPAAAPGELELAFTGVESLALAGLGSTMLLTGAAFLSLARRRED